MATAKENPKRWYLVMLFCILMAFVSFLAGPKLGLEPEAVHTAAILIGLGAPVTGIMGLRAEIMKKS